MKFLINIQIGKGRKRTFLVINPSQAKKNYVCRSQILKFKFDGFKEVLQSRLRC